MTDDYEIIQLRKAIVDLIPMIEGLTEAVEGGIDLNQSRWDYDWATISFDEMADGKTIQKLDEFGKRGWEYSGYSQEMGEAMQFLMKRRLPE